LLLLLSFVAYVDLSYFKQNPQPFCTLAKELFPGEYYPTRTHHFIKMLHDKGVLLRNFTQNIDGLEFLAGVPKDKVVQAHGGFQTAHCIDCHKEYDEKFVKDLILDDSVPTCIRCNGLVKPDIVFFGERLPERFNDCLKEDFPKCDCLIVMGTSLTVQPFASLIDR
jgi:NAD-dependent protein deacetylase sirtuin 2